MKNSPLLRVWLLFSLAAAASAQPGGPTQVIVGPIVERDIPPTIRLVGTVNADKRAVVATEVSGIVADFPPVEGRFFKAGEVVCRLDPEVPELRLREAQGQLDALQATLDELEAGTRPETIALKKAALDVAEAIASKWRFEKRRVDELAEQARSNEKEVHDTQMEYVAAESRLAMATAELDEAKNGPRKQAIDKARYDVLAQKAIVDRLARELAKTQMKAPFDGFVVSRRTEVGEWVQAGNPIYELVSIEKVRIRVDVPEAAIPFAREGSPASVVVEALDRSYEGTVTRVIPLASPAARTFPVEIDIANTDHTLLPGMFVWAQVASGPPGKRLLVSKDAVVAQGLSKQIFVIVPGADGAKTAMPTPVTTGLETGGLIAVEAPGLHAGGEVVIRGNERLFAPTPVITRPAAPPATSPASQPAAAAGDPPPTQARPAGGQ